MKFGVTHTAAKQQAEPNAVKGCYEVCTTYTMVRAPVPASLDGTRAEGANCKSFRIVVTHPASAHSA